MNGVGSAQSIEVVTSATEKALQYGILGVLALVFGLVIRYLYTQARADRADYERKLIEAERREESLRGELKQQATMCSLEKELITKEHFRLLREKDEQCADAVAEVNSESRIREDAKWRELIEIADKLRERIRPRGP